jgi:cell division protein FtsB
MDRFVYREEKKRKKGNNASSVGSLFDNTVVKLILLGISIFLFYNIGHSISITIQKLDILRRAQMEVDSLRVENLELDLLLSSMQSKEYLEIQARDRLNFAGEREYVFVVPENLLKEKDTELNRILYGEVEAVEGSVYKVWEDFFLRGI